MTEKIPLWKRTLLKMGHLQAQIILFLLFWLILTPYALVLRLIGCRLMGCSGWCRVEGKVDLERLRRTF